MSGRPRILIVEDGRDVVLGLSLRLNAAGYDVAIAYDGQAGLAAARECRPDAIMLDIRMPVMDGLTVLARLSESANTKGIPVVVLSANVAETARRQALDLGARYFLAKPYDAAKIVQALQSVLNRTPADPPERPAREDCGPAQSGKIVLIADDDRAVVEMLTQHCQELGLSVRTASDGLDALTQIVKELPDLAILDIGMPAADGLSVYERIVADRDLPPFPVIILTGKSDEELIHRCESLGAHYVRKSIVAWDELAVKIRALVPGLTGGSATVTPTPTPTAPTADRQSPRVLVIDDDPAVSQFIQIRLQCHGVEVLRAFDGTQGFRIAMNERPQVIVTDLHMPNGCGNYLLRRIKMAELTKDIPIIFLSGHNIEGRKDYGQIRDIVTRGAVAFLTKPLDYDAFKNELRLHIDFPEVA